MKAYHIYFENNCIFKNLTEGQFNTIWLLLNTEYNSELSYEEMTETVQKQKEYEESSF